MSTYVGLDVSLRETMISVRREGKRVWRGKCSSDPLELADLIRLRAPDAERVVFETGPLSTWFYHVLTEQGLPAICIDARHAKAALSMAVNKTDANDADALAQLAEVGFYREVRVKSFDSMLARTRVAAREQLLGAVTQVSNQIRGLMKTFGLVVPKSAGRRFDEHVRRLVATNPELERIILPLLEAWRALRAQTAALDRQLLAAARKSRTCAVLMTIPGIGAVTASSFVAAVEEPENFRSSRSVGAWLGLTPRRYQSGEVDHSGGISRRGDPRLRGLLYEAAVVILTRHTGDSAIKTWGVGLRERLGFKRAAVAVARKLSVIMHRMLVTGEVFNRAAIA